MKNQRLKEILKQYAVDIRKAKATRKSVPNGYVPELEAMRWNARHFHIAYCMLRGRKYEEIEPRCHEEPNMARVEKIMEDYREAVCTSA